MINESNFSAFVKFDKKFLFVIEFPLLILLLFKEDFKVFLSVIQFLFEYKSFFKGSIAGIIALSCI